MSTKKSAKSRKNKVPLKKAPINRVLSVETPVLYYDIQQELEKIGVALVDLKTGSEITGQVNIYDIGLIAPGKKRKPIYRMGFIQSKVPESFQTLDVDAVLKLDASYQVDNAPLVLLIQVINEADIPLWKKLAFQAVQKFAHKEGRFWKTEVFFLITSLSRLQKVSDTARQSALRCVQQYGFGNDTYGVSSMYLRVDDFDVYDDEDGG